MKRTVTIFLTTLLVALFATTGVMAQESGDFRSAADGDWSATATWETYDGSDWVDADAAPDGSENISITDTVSVDVDGAITGYISVLDEGVLEVADGASLTFNDGGTYEHARDGGDMPESTWEVGSTAAITGTVGSAPGNRGQDYYNLTLNTPDKTSNVHMDFDGNTVRGDIDVIDTGSSRWYLLSASATESASVTLEGDVNVEAGQFSVQGTGNALTTFTVDHYGDINVTGGNFSIARGSQGSGSGTTTWNLYGSFNMSDDTEAQNSNPDGAKFVFAAGGNQIVNFGDVDFGSRVNYDVSDSTNLEIADGTDFLVSGTLANSGEVTTTGTLTIDDGGTYDHARDGGDIPDATWSEGSTAMITGTETSAPGNRGQSYHHLILNTPDKLSNTDLDLDGQTISGDITVVSTGSSRWYLLKASSGESASVDIMGDIMVEDGQFGVQGTGNGETTFTVNHYGDVNTSGGNFSPARGSQGGTGTTTWNFFGDSFSVDSTTIQSSNSDGTQWVFAKNGTSTMSLDGTDYSGSALQLTVSDSTTLDLADIEIGSGGDFIVHGTVATSHPDGISGNVQTSGEVSFAGTSGVLYNGTESQADGIVAIADSIGAATVANAEGVAFNDSLYIGAFNVEAGAEAHIDTSGNISTSGGSVEGTLVNSGAIETTDDATITFGAEATYEHAQDGGSMPMGTWSEGSTALFTGTVTSAPDNRAQDYYNVTFNAPDQISNVDLDLDDNTISGDIHVISSGLARWYLTSPSGDPEVTKEVTLMGDITMDAGAFSSNGSGNPGDIVVHHYGSVTVNEGNFSVSRGSQASGTSSTNWYFYEGDMTLNAGTSQNSNPDNAQWVFAGGADVVHNITMAEDYNINGSGMQIVVSDSSALDLNSSALNSGGNFTVEAGGTLWSSHPESFDGNLSEITGNVDITNESYFVLDGEEAQITSFTLPLVVNGLTINNEAGVTQSRGLTINEFLRLEGGEFDNTVGFTLGDGAEIINEGGSLTIPVSNENEGEGIPDKFALNQNYPNPFNPTTTISYDVPEAANVTLTVFDITGREVAQLVNSRQSAGVYEVDWNAQNLATGVYIYRIQAGNFTAVRKLTLIK